MTNRYDVSLGEIKREDGSGTRNFSVSFLVEPPIMFTSRQGPAELGDQALNAIVVHAGIPLERTQPGPQSSHGLVSFTHELPDAEATVGNFSGLSEAEISPEAVLTALRQVLNGPA